MKEGSDGQFGKGAALVVKASFEKGQPGFEKHFSPNSFAEGVLAVLGATRCVPPSSGSGSLKKPLLFFYVLGWRGVSLEK